MVFTLEALYIVTTAKKGMTHSSFTVDLCLPLSSLTAKHLEPLKGGKVPVEILVRGKDTEQNAKHFEKCLNVIKGAGVGLFYLMRPAQHADCRLEESRHNPQRFFNWTLCRRMEKSAR